MLKFFLMFGGLTLKIKTILVKTTGKKNKKQNTKTKKKLEAFWENGQEPVLNGNFGFFKEC
jgi:hypothetical protein